MSELLLEGQTIGGKSLLPLLIWSDSSLLLREVVATQSVKSLDVHTDRRVKAALGDELEEMLQEAEIILQGRTISSRTALADDYYGRKQVYTFYTIHGNVPLKGRLADHKHFTLQVIGGRIPNSDIEIIVTHMPRLTIGKDTILFLKRYVDKMGVLRGDRGQVDL